MLQNLAHFRVDFEASLVSDGPEVLPRQAAVQNIAEYAEYVEVFGPLPLLSLGLLSISLSPIIARVLTSSATIIAFWRMLFASLFLWIALNFLASSLKC